jgi:uncharacterized protein YbbK (DUF523 family)
MKLISACIAGIFCRYDGQTRRREEIIALVQSGKALAVCPETLGGLKIPREPAEIVGGDGFDVLDGKAKVMTCDGEDVTTEFVNGAQAALSLCRRYGARKVFLKSKSPSCGVGIIYDGTFSGTLRPGFGVTAALLKRNHIKVVEID